MKQAFKTVLYIVMIIRYMKKLLLLLLLASMGSCSSGSGDVLSQSFFETQKGKIWVKQDIISRDSGNEELLYISFGPSEVLRGSVWYNGEFEECKSERFLLQFETDDDDIIGDDEYYMDISISVNTLNSLSIVYKKRRKGSETYIYEDIQTFRVMKDGRLFDSLNENEGYGDRREYTDYIPYEGTYEFVFPSCVPLDLTN